MAVEGPRGRLMRAFVVGTPTGSWREKCLGFRLGSFTLLGLTVS